MKNFVRDEDQITVPAPAALNSGQGVLIGQLFGVAVASAASGANVALQTTGVVSLPKANAVSTSAAIGANIHWDATNSQTTVSATSNAKIGVAVVASANTDAAVTVRLSGAW